MALSVGGEAACRETGDGVGEQEIETACQGLLLSCHATFPVPNCITQLFLCNLPLAVAKSPEACLCQTQVLFLCVLGPCIALKAKREDLCVALILWSECQNVTLKQLTP